MPSTPSYLPVPITLATCEPHTAVAPSSSFRPGHEAHVELVEDRPLLADHRVEAADGRTRVSRDQTGGAQPGAPVGAALVDDRAHDRVHPADRDVAAISGEAVAQLERGDRHALQCVGCTPDSPDLSASNCPWGHLKQTERGFGRSRGYQEVAMYWVSQNS